MLRLRDPVGGTRGALLHMAPLRPGESARAAYRLPTTKRGIIRVGPLTLEVADPFGLAARSAVAAPMLELTVYPKVDDVAAPGGGGDRNPHGAAANPNALGRQGDDFYALREYVVGDDLRRVHWASTARMDELMVRHDEMPWQDRTTVVLDVRRASHTAASMERAVSAAASIVTAVAREQHLMRFLASDGVDSSTGTGMAHIEGVMEYLARIEAVGTGSLRSVLDGLVRGGQGGVLVTVLGRATSGELEALARLHRSFRMVVVVVTEGPMPPGTPLQRRLIKVDATRDAAFGAGLGGDGAGQAGRRGAGVSVPGPQPRRRVRHRAGAARPRRGDGVRLRPPVRRLVVLRAAGLGGGGVEPDRHGLPAPALGSRPRRRWRRWPGWRCSSASPSTARSAPSGLPTRATWHVLVDDLSAAWSSFPTAVALVPADTGYLVSAVVAIWVAMFLADSFAFRAGAGPETLVAPGILFVFCSALAGDRLRLLSTALWLGAAVLGLRPAPEHARRERERLAHQPPPGARSRARRGSGAVIGVSAIAIAVVVGPALPGYGQDALINTKNPRSGTRTTVSPLVDIRGRIAQQSTTEAFTVKSPTDGVLADDGARQVRRADLVVESRLPRRRRPPRRRAAHPAHHVGDPAVHHHHARLDLAAGGVLAVHHRRCRRRPLRLGHVQPRHPEGHASRRARPTRSPRPSRT